MTDIDILKKKIVPILVRYKIKKAGIFGSYAKGNAKKNSDVDILIQARSGKFSLLDLVGLEQELEEKIGKKVDLVTYKGISPFLKTGILKEEVRIL